MRNFGYMRILTGWVMNTGTDIALKMSYLWCFWFSFCQGYIVNKTRHYSAEGTPLHMFHRHYSTGDWVLHIVDNLNFCVSFFVHNSWIWAQFDDLAADLGLRYRVHRALSNTEKMLFGVCFAFPMCFLTDVKCCMTSTKGNTTVLEAQQCTFWKLVMKISSFMYNAWLCLQLDHAAAHLDSRSFVQRDANNTETVLFTMFFAFLLYGHNAKYCNMTWPMAHEANW